MVDDPKPGGLNPYAPPQGDDAPPPDPIVAPDEVGGRRRSAIPKVFGILSVVLSGLMLAYTALLWLALLTVSLSSRASSSGSSTAPAASFDLFRSTGPVIPAVLGVCFTVMTVALLVIGIGQLRYRAWAGQWTVRWSLAAMAQIVLAPAVVLLVTREPTHITPMIPALLVYLAPYPTLLLILFTRPHVRAAMTR